MYGRELLAKLEELRGANNPVLFSHAVAGHLPYEICRYLLAGLQLVCRLSCCMLFDGAGGCLSQR